MQQQNILPVKLDTIILILSYNQFNNIRKPCPFYSKQPIDILFVDNHSNDRTFEFLFRNSLLVYGIYHGISKIITIGTILIKNIWNGIFSFFYDRNICWLLQIKDGFCDLIRLQFPNKRQIEQYRKCELKPKNYKIKELELGEFI